MPEDGAWLPTPDEIEETILAAILPGPEPPKWLTLSGNAKPTLPPAFPAIVDRVCSLRDRTVSALCRRAFG